MQHAGTCPATGTGIRMLDDVRATGIDVPHPAQAGGSTFTSSLAHVPETDLLVWLGTTRTDSGRSLWTPRETQALAAQGVLPWPLWNTTLVANGTARVEYSHIGLELDKGTHLWHRDGLCFEKSYGLAGRAFVTLADAEGCVEGVTLAQMGLVPGWYAAIRGYGFEEDTFNARWFWGATLEGAIQTRNEPHNGDTDYVEQGPKRCST